MADGIFGVVLNVVLAAVYIGALSKGAPRRTWARCGLAAMVRLTAFDYSLARLLRKCEAS